MIRNIRLEFTQNFNTSTMKLRNTEISPRHLQQFYKSFQSRGNSGISHSNSGTVFTRQRRFRLGPELTSQHRSSRLTSFQKTERNLSRHLLLTSVTVVLVDCSLFFLRRT